jgi:hypothetical protein
MYQLKVYDRKNQARLLGTLEVPAFKGDYYHVPLMSATTTWRRAYEPNIQLTVEEFTAEFYREWVTTGEDETPFSRVVKQESILTTDTPLGTLMKLRQFKPEGIEHRPSYRDLF